MAEMTDRELRLRALELALDGLSQNAPNETVFGRAEAFYQWLKGPQHPKINEKYGIGPVTIESLIDPELVTLGDIAEIGPERDETAPATVTITARAGHDVLPATDPTTTEVQS